MMTEYRCSHLGPLGKSSSRKIDVHILTADTCDSNFFGNSRRCCEAMPTKVGPHLVMEGPWASDRGL